MIERGNPLFAVTQVTRKASNLEECSMFWIMLTVFPQTSNFCIKKLCCMCLKTIKQWSKLSLKEEALQWDMFPEPTELLLIGCLIELIWIPKSKSNTSTPKNQLADILTKGSFTSDEWNHLLCLFNISHFSPTVCSAAMAKRSQQDSGEERVTAKSRPLMNLIARTPSFVSSSTSATRWRDITVIKIHGNQLLEKIDQGDLVKKQIYSKPLNIAAMSSSWKASLQQIIQNWITTMLGLLKSGKVRQRTIHQGNLIKLLREWCNKFVLVTKKFFSTEPRNP